LLVEKNVWGDYFYSDGYVTSSACSFYGYYVSGGLYAAAYDDNELNFSNNLKALT